MKKGTCITLKCGKVGMKNDFGLNRSRRCGGMFSVMVGWLVWCEDNIKTLSDMRRFDYYRLFNGTLVGKPLFTVKIPKQHKGIYV